LYLSAWHSAGLEEEIMTDSDLSISFTVTKPDGDIETHEFSANDSIKIGSGKSAQLKLEGEDISSLHCMVKPTSDGALLLDLGSDEGIELNGKEVEGEAEIEDGDTIHVGEYRVTVYLGGELLDPTTPIQAHHEDMVAAEATVKEPAPISEEEPAASEEPVITPADEATTIEAKPESKEETSPEKKPKRSKKKKKTKSKSKSEASSGEGETKKPRKKSKKSKTASESKADSGDEKSSSSSKKAKKEDAEKASPPKRSKSEAAKPKKKSDSGGGHGSARTSLVKTEELNPVIAEKDQSKEKTHLDVTMLWGGSVVGVHRVSTGDVTIGNHSACDFQVSHESLTQGQFVLATMGPTGAVVKVATGMQLIINGSESSKSEVNLDLGQEVTVRVGSVDFLIQYAKKYQSIKVGLFQTLDYFYSKVFGLALLLQIGMIVAFLITPSFDEDDEEDLMAHLNEFQALILQQPEKKKEQKKSGKKAAKRKDDEGIFGKKDKPKEDKLASKGAPKIDKDKREEDKKAAMDALAALGLTDAPTGAGLGTGVNQALGGLRGASMGDAGGAGGLGSRGTGAGGGGNSLGIGGLGSGTGRGSGGKGGIDLGGRGKGMTRIKPGKVIFKGSLSREEIQRVIRRVMSQIKFCYERELAKDPNLQGKLVATWTIMGTGLVQKSRMSQNTMGNKKVESCVLRIINRLRFPKPKGGGSVFVTYPFVFSSSG
jgi:outer membrane biosynthesis protein TonB